MKAQKIGSDKPARRGGIGKRTTYPVQIPTFPGMTSGRKKELRDQHFLKGFSLFGQKILKQGFVEIVFLSISAFH